MKKADWKVALEELVEGFQKTKEIHDDNNVDMVNEPPHYKSGKYECIEIMEDTFGIESLSNFCICNAFKYIFRFKKKNGIEDIKKAQFYLNKYIELNDKE